MCGLSLPDSDLTLRHSGKFLRCSALSLMRLFAASITSYVSQICSRTTVLGDYVND